MINLIEGEKIISSKKRVKYADAFDSDIHIEADQALTEADERMSIDTGDSVSFPLGVQEGTVVVTNFRLIVFRAKDTLQISLGSIARVEKEGAHNTNLSKPYGIYIETKHMMRFQLLFEPRKLHPRRPVYEALKQYCFPFSYAISRGRLGPSDAVLKFPAFQHMHLESNLSDSEMKKESKKSFFKFTPSVSPIIISNDELMNQDHPQISPTSPINLAHVSENKFNGWGVADLVDKDYIRITASFEKNWRKSMINAEQFSFCSSYPKFLYVPSNVHDNVLIQVAEFRTKKRIPILSWLHPENGVSLTRSSQPKPGLRSNRSVSDETYLKAILEASHVSDGKLHIMDARPRANALANQAAGAGFELLENYHSNITLSFMNIDNIHVVRESFKKLSVLINTILPRSYISGADEELWQEKWLQTGWIQLIQRILYASLQIVKMMDKKKTSVLVHCSDGWDRSPMLTSLAQLCMDPFYRSFHGFIILVQKEWMYQMLLVYFNLFSAQGHKFHQRLGNGQKDYDDPQRSPIFLQFLDCVFQLLAQFPSQFEFTSQFLILFYDTILSCQYGTFLMNSDKERSVHNLSTKTLSAWTLLHNIFYSNSSNIYKNAFYFSNGSRVLYPSVVSRHLIYWNEMFSRWDNFKQTTELIPKSLHLPLSHFIGNVLGNFEDADSLTRSENHDNQKTLKLGIFRTFSDKYLNHSKSQNLQISTNESSMSSQNLSTSLTDNVKTIISRWPFFWQSVLTVFADQINVQNSFDNQESNSDPLLNNRSVLFSAELNQSVSSIDTELNNIAITTNELDEDPDSD